MTFNFNVTLTQPLTIVVKSDPATDTLLAEIVSNQHKIMSAISDFATKQNAHNDAVDAAVSGISADIAGLNDIIAKLQASAGQITPEDQALLDALDARGQAIADKLATLDALTPPVAPV